MESYWSNVRELSSLEIFLIGCIIIFFISILLFIFLILKSRMEKISKERLRKKNSLHINQTLFAIAFDEKTFEDVKKDRKFKRNWKRKFYRQQFLNELIQLHRLYDGKIAHNLRKCYINFRLIQLSYEKIRSRKWEIKCAGIQELSEMEIKKAVPLIFEHTKSKNQTLKMVALIEVIHLSGLEGISFLEDYKEHLNDWIQLNLLESIKETHSDNVPDFGYLLESQNESIVVFGLRLLKLFHQNQHLSAVKKLLNSPSRRIKAQAVITYEQLIKTAEARIPDEAYQPLRMDDKIAKTKQKDSYSRTVLLIVILSSLLILTLVALYLVNHSE